MCSCCAERRLTYAKSSGKLSARNSGSGQPFRPALIQAKRGATDRRTAAVSPVEMAVSHVCTAVTAARRHPTVSVMTRAETVPGEGEIAVQPMRFATATTR